MLIQENKPNYHLKMLLLEEIKMITITIFVTDEIKSNK